MKVNSVKRAAIINMSSKYIVIVIQLIYTAVLSRLLTPEDYGIVAIINVFVNFFNILADMGIGSAIIQWQDLDKEEINSIFTFSCLISILLALFFYALSCPIAMFYDDSVYLKLGPLLSFSVLFNTLNTVPNALLMKEKKFMRVAIRQVVVAVVCSIFAIITAVMGWRYYSLILYSVLYAIIAFAWNFKDSGLSLVKHINMNSIKKIKSYSTYLFGFNIVNYFSRNLDNMLIGRSMGKTAVGSYNKAYQLMLYPTNNLARVITPVLHPFLAKRQTETEYLYTSFIKTVKIFSLISVFIQMICFFGSNELVNILYGNQWEETRICFKILSLSVWSQMICSASGAYFQALNATDIQMRRGITDTLIMIIGIFTGIRFKSIMVISMCVMISYNLNFFTMLYYLIRKTFKKDITSFLILLLPDFVIEIGLAICFYLISLFSIDNYFLSLIVKLIIAGITFVFLLLVTKQMHYFTHLIPQKLMFKIIKIIKKVI